MQVVWCVIATASNANGIPRTPGLRGGGCRPACTADAKRRLLQLQHRYLHPAAGSKTSRRETRCRSVVHATAISANGNIWNAANDWSSPSIVSADGDLDAIYLRSDTTPTTPAPSSGVPTGWFGSVPQGTGAVWVSIGIRSGGNQNFTWDAPIPLESVRYREVRAYRVRSVSQSAPGRPTGGSYNFTTNVYTSPSAWVNDFPSYTAGQVVYSVVATADSGGLPGAVWTGVSADWSSPVIVADDGDLNAIYIRADSAPATPAPSAGIPTSWFDAPPSGQNALWVSIGIRRSHETQYTWGDPSPLGLTDGDLMRIAGMVDVARTVPGFFQISVTNAQQTLINAEGTTLTNQTLINLADTATPDDNLDGDWVNFYRGGTFASAWVWDSTPGEWVRAQGRIAAESIYARDLSALNIQVVDADVSGEITALHLTADVRNARVLWAGSQFVDNTPTVDFELSDNVSNWDFLLVEVVATNEGYAGTLGVPVNLIPNNESAFVNDGSSNGQVSYFTYQGGSGAGDGFQVRIWRAAGNNLRFRGRSSAEEGYVKTIIGFRNPVEGTTPTPTPTPTPQAIPGQCLTFGVRHCEVNNDIYSSCWGSGSVD